MASYTLGGVTFKNMADVKARAQKILAFVHPITDPSDDAFLRDLLARHERSEWYLSKGVVSFHVVSRGTGPFGRGFSFIDSTGEQVDWGYQSCVYVKPRHPLWKAKRAARQEIKEQIEDFRVYQYREINSTCPVTGKYFSIEDSHVDHIAPKTFAFLFDEFAKTVTLSELTDITCEAHLDARPRFTDPTISCLWRHFHRENANLRLLSKEGHKIVTHGKNGDES